MDLNTHLREFFKLRPLTAPSCEPISAITTEGRLLVASWSRRTRANVHLGRGLFILEIKTYSKRRTYPIGPLPAMKACATTTGMSTCGVLFTSTVTVLWLGKLPFAGNEGRFGEAKIAAMISGVKRWRDMASRRRRGINEQTHSKNLYSTLVYIIPKG
jgi:hypothetical protein